MLTSKKETSLEIYLSFCLTKLRLQNTFTTPETVQTEGACQLYFEKG